MTVMKCPVCNAMIKCVECHDFICPNPLCGEDLEDHFKQRKRELRMIFKSNKKKEDK